MASRQSAIAPGVARIAHLARHGARPHHRGALRRQPRRLAVTTHAMMPLVAAQLAPLVGGGALVLGAAGLLVWQAVKAVQQGGQSQEQDAAAEDAEELPRRNAVLVFGATGRTGRQVVAEVRKKAVTK